MKEDLIRDVENYIKEIIENDIIGSYEGLDCFFEDNELSDSEIEFIQNLKVVNLTLH